MKLTREETIRALECCSSNDDHDVCFNCSLYTADACINELSRNALHYLREEDLDSINEKLCNHLAQLDKLMEE